MADRKFAHLHLHTHYSLLDGFNRIPQLVEQTAKLGMNAVAITDHGPVVLTAHAEHDRLPQLALERETVCWPR